MSVSMLRLLKVASTAVRQSRSRMTESTAASVST